MQTADLKGTLMSILEMTATVDELANGSSRLGKAALNDGCNFMQGRSRRRRRRRRKDGSSSDDSDDEGRERSSPLLEGRRSSTSETNIDSKMKLMMEELEVNVQVLRERVNRFAGEGDQGQEAGEVRATWRMLAFALDDWR